MGCSSGTEPNEEENFAHLAEGFWTNCFFNLNVADPLTLMLNPYTAILTPYTGILNPYMGILNPYMGNP